METREVRYKDEPETLIQADCTHCGHKWFPFENVGYTVHLPVELVLDCPKCGKKSECFFPDHLMEKEILHRKHVLGYDKRIKNALEKVKQLEKERDEWKNHYEDESEKNKVLTKAIDRVTEKLEQLGVQVDDDKNPLSN